LSEEKTSRQEMKRKDILMQKERGSALNYGEKGEASASFTAKKQGKKNSPFATENKLGKRKN